MVQGKVRIICSQGSSRLGSLKYPISPENLKSLSGEETEAWSNGEGLHRMLSTWAPASASRVTHHRPGVFWRSCWRRF